MINLSLVIPCYNEAANLPLLIERCEAVFAGRTDVEVILVDNGSSDSTAEVLAERLDPEGFVRSVRVEVNQGYGFGILSGLRAAEGHVLAWTHADMQTDPRDALIGLEHFERADDPRTLFVKGRRYGRPAFDVVFTVGMAAFETALLQTPMWDINAQPTMFHRDFFATWEDPPGDFSIDLFAYYRAREAGLTFVRFPVHFGPRAFGDSTWNTGLKARWGFIKRTVGFSLQMKRERVG